MEGRLESITVHDVRECGLWDALSGKRIPCRFPSNLIETMGANINKRVVVEGELHYTRGEITMVDVETIAALPDGLPEQSWYGIGRDWFPEDMDSELKELWTRE
jgi:hypothetical protein